MSKLDISIFIPIISVIISVVSSIVITALKNKSELKNIKTQLEQRYATSLFDKRVEIYPNLFFILSNYGKIIEYGKQTKTNLTEFRDNLDSWDSKNAIYLTPPIFKFSWRFRKYLNLVLSTCSESELSETNWDDLRNILIQYAKVIRAEIGIFDSKPVGTTGDIETVYNSIDSKITELSS